MVHSTDEGEGSSVRSPKQGDVLHTPTPWTVMSGPSPTTETLFWVDGDYETVSVCDLYHLNRDGTIYSKKNAEANAARIVHCVNLHDELVEAVEMLLEWPGGSSEHFARAVLAKARGKE